ncbi:MAG: extracellular solute-binding protein, partial [Algicola sp.]|nr:extracellular solute-binding protein [Algicola sp.]
TMRGSGTTLSRIQFEQVSPKADIWFGGSLGAHAQAATEGLLSPYKSRHYESLKPQLRNPMGNDTVQSLYAGILVFVINKDLLASKGLPMPKSWQDLNKPIYNGLIGLRKPALSGTGYTMLLSLITLMGEDQAFSYMEPLYRNAGHVGSRQMRRLFNQRTAISILFLHDFLFEKHEQDSLDFVIPSEGTSYEIGGLSLIKNRPNTVAAQQFVDFVLNPSQQKAHWQESWRLPVNSKVNLGAKVLDLDDVRLVRIDFGWAGANRQRLLQRWTKMMSKTRIQNKEAQQ